HRSDAPPHAAPPSPRPRSSPSPALTTSPPAPHRQPSADPPTASMWRALVPPPRSTSPTPSQAVLRSTDNRRSCSRPFFNLAGDERLARSTESFDHREELEVLQRIRRGHIVGRELTDEGTQRNLEIAEFRERRTHVRIIAKTYDKERGFSLSSKK